VIYIAAKSEKKVRDELRTSVTDVALISGSRLFHINGAETEKLHGLKPAGTTRSL